MRIRAPSKTLYKQVCHLHPDKWWSQISQIRQNAYANPSWENLYFFDRCGAILFNAMEPICQAQVYTKSVLSNITYPRVVPTRCRCKEPLDRYYKLLRRYTGDTTVGRSESDSEHSSVSPLSSSSSEDEQPDTQGSQSDQTTQPTEPPELEQTVNPEEPPKQAPEDESADLSPPSPTFEKTNAQPNATEAEQPYSPQSVALSIHEDDTIEVHARYVRSATHDITFEIMKDLNGLQLSHFYIVRYFHVQCLISISYSKTH